LGLAGRVLARQGAGHDFRLDWCTILKTEVKDGMHGFNRQVEIMEPYLAFRRGNPELRNIPGVIDAQLLFVPPSSVERFPLGFLFFPGRPGLLFIIEFAGVFVFVALQNRFRCFRFDPGRFSELFQPVSNIFYKGMCHGAGSVE